MSIFSSSHFICFYWDRLIRCEYAFIRKIHSRFLLVFERIGEVLSVYLERQWQEHIDMKEIYGTSKYTASQSCEWFYRFLFSISMASNGFYGNLPVLYRKYKPSIWIGIYPHIQKFTAFLHFLNICLGLWHSPIRRISHHTALSFLVRHGWRIAKMTRIYNCIASFLKLFLKFLKFERERETERERERERERPPRRSRGGCVRLLGCIRP